MELLHVTAAPAYGFLFSCLPHDAPGLDPTPSPFSFAFRRIGYVNGVALSTPGLSAIAEIREICLCSLSVISPLFRLVRSRQIRFAHYLSFSSYQTCASNQPHVDSHSAADTTPSRDIISSTSLAQGSRVPMVACRQLPAGSSGAPRAQKTTPGSSCQGGIVAFVACSAAFIGPRPTSFRRICIPRWLRLFAWLAAVLVRPQLSEEHSASWGVQTYR